MRRQSDFPKLHAGTAADSAARFRLTALLSSAGSPDILRENSLAGQLPPASNLSLHRISSLFILHEKRFEVKDTFKRLLYEISNVATYYRDNRKQLAIQNKPLLERDIATINQLYVALCTKVEAASSRERYIPFILEPDLVNELFRILEISNGAIHRYDKLLCEIR